MLPHTEGGTGKILLKDEIFNFWRQSHISSKNVARLNELMRHPDKEIAKLASIVLRVAYIKPYKRKRLRVIAGEDGELLKELEETGLILAHGI